MARIRTIKPEAFRSRTVKKLSYPTRWTFFGLLVQVDDKGRGIDDIDLIRADIYPLEMDEVSAKDVEMHIEELCAPGIDMVCRYSVDGERYLHVINFAKHQRINRPSESHIPCCPVHGDSGSPKGRKPAPKPDPEPTFTEPSQPSHAPLTEDAVSPQPSCARAGSGREEEKEVEEECASVGYPPTGIPLTLFEAAPPAPTGPPDPEPVEPTLNARTLIAAWIEYRTKDNPDNKPPEVIIKRAGGQVKKLLDEGFAYETVRRGFAEWDAKGADPSAIPSFVNQVQSRRASGRGASLPVQRPSATTLRTQAGMDLIQQFAAEEGVDLATVIPLVQRRGITA